MSPRYEYDPSKASATIEVFPKDVYTFKVGQPKAFARKEGPNDDIKNYGIRFPLTIQDGEYRNKNTVFTAYLHNDGSMSMTKRFQMAALGYGKGKEEEHRFNAEQGGKDWSFDPDTGAVGEAWQQFAGADVVCALDIQKNKNTQEEMQAFQTWIPLQEFALANSK